MLLTNQAEYDLELLFYYPFTIGTHLSYSIKILQEINRTLLSTPLKRGRSKIEGIGVYEHDVIGNKIIILRFIWLSNMRSFFYTKSNFITFTNVNNISSVHPSFYKKREESYFLCDNGYSVVWRNYGKKKVFNFIDSSGNIISDIDFVQVKPFKRENNMIARGYTPNRRCYAVYCNGKRKEVNESSIDCSKNKVMLTESYLKKIIKAAIQKYVTK